ncbi:Uncharacterized protein PRO82_001977 [Candidatus Protochlamydia amoebophila]|uniref:hypothetical protein n=1 Tax=Candidatus Protochlamydia amoebophila TaxID=362787 RepID=UPI001BC8DF3A|nr:hypothetical protein [Candidatus Protochlamydia amoebophila]MBS4164646.1 Uncharacterized protein [Candidatus Protochlamydia amoebophila]
MAYITVGYFTENTPYEEEIRHLAESLERFHLPMDLVAVPTQGSWQANTQYKAYFIKQMLVRHYPKNILYLDADARVQQYPALFDQIDADLAVFYWHNKELISSTLYFANNAKIAELIERWITCCFENPDIWDQKVLQYVIQESKDLKLRIDMLPPSYCQIFDLMQQEGEPVIEQFQASRRFKTQIDSSKNEA